MIAHESEPDVVQSLPPGEAVAVYDVIALPPVDAGATHVTLSDDPEGAALTPVGAPGTVAGVTGELAEDGDPVPTALVAVTVKV